MSIELHNIRVSYEQSGHSLLALDDLHLTLEQGRVTALIGESGCGKTTLGKSIMGLLPARARISGTIRLNGTPLPLGDETAMNRLRWSRVAMVFQNGVSTLNPAYTIARQVMEPLRVHSGLGEHEARRRAAAMLKSLDLAPELHERYPHQLSGGQIQRALLGMAMILDPEYLILDEPTAALDPGARALVMDLMRATRRNGKGVLLISHDLDLAAGADTAAVLYQGQIMEILPGPELLRLPRHPYTKALLRSFPGIDTPRNLMGMRGEPLLRLLPGKEVPNAPAGGGHTGCLFRERCPQAVEACAREAVSMQGNGERRIRCLRGGIVPAIVLEGVSKSYDRIKALHETDLTVYNGEVLCLIGETGSGKSTLAMIAGGSLLPDTGRRLLHGQDVHMLDRKTQNGLRADIGFIYQNPLEAVSHRLNVFQIVAEPIRIQRAALPGPGMEALVVAALRDAGLPCEHEFLHKYPHELNAGAVQRLCIARALVLRPSIIIADEPTSSLDPGVQAKILKMLLELQTEKGLTLLFITHDLGVAGKIADRIAVLHKGRIIELGPAEDIFNRPAHPYTARLLQLARAGTARSREMHTREPKPGLNNPV